MIYWCLNANTAWRFALKYCSPSASNSERFYACRIFTKGCRRKNPKVYTKFAVIISAGTSSWSPQLNKHTVVREDVQGRGTTPNHAWRCKLRSARRKGTPKQLLSLHPNPPQQLTGLYILMLLSACFAKSLEQTLSCLRAWVPPLLTGSDSAGLANMLPR